MSETQAEKNWYEQTWVIVLCLIFFFPVGLTLMWYFADWSNVFKFIVTIGVVAFIFMFIIMIFLFIFGVIEFITYTINVMSMVDMHTSDPEPISGIGENDNQTSENNNLSDEEANREGIDETVLDQFDIQFDDRDW